MDKITLGQIKEIILWIVAISGATATLYTLLIKGIGKLLQPIKDAIRKETIERLKSDLTTFMYLAEHGDLSNEQKLRAHEEYDEYISMKGNSWVHDKFESLVKEGKL